MDTDALFKRIVIISTAVYVLQLALLWIEIRFVSQDVANALSWHGFGAVLQVPFVFYWIVALLYMPLAVGLCRFSPASRSLFLALTVFVHVWSLLDGLRIETALGATLQSLSTLGDGAIIALAFTPPLRERFQTPGRSGDTLFPVALIGLLGLATCLSLGGSGRPWWLGWVALLCQPFALWLLMALQRGVPLPEWLFPVRGRWLRHLGWLVLLGGAGIAFGDATRLSNEFPVWGGVALWVAVETVVLLVSAAVFMLAYRLVGEHLEMVKMPLDDGGDPPGGNGAGQAS